LKETIQNSTGKIFFFLRRNLLKENVENLTNASGVATWSKGTHINLKEAPRVKKNIFRAGMATVKNRRPDLVRGSIFDCQTSLERSF